MFKLDKKIIAVILSSFILLVAVTFKGINIRESEPSIKRYEDIIFTKKVTELNEMIDSFNPEDMDYSPRSINEFTRSCGDKLKEILNTQGSILSTPHDILDNMDTFYIKFRDIVSIEDNSYRLIEFGNSKLSDGGMLFLYLQTLNKGDVVSLQSLTELVQTASGTGEFGFYDIFKRDENTFISIISTVEGVDSNYLNILSYRVDASGLTEIKCTMDSSQLDDWILRKAEGISECTLSYIYNSTYSFSSDDGDITINALDSKGSIVSSLKMDFEKNGYFFK